MRRRKSRRTPIAISRDPYQSTAIAVLRETDLAMLDALDIGSEFPNVFGMYSVVQYAEGTSEATWPLQS